MSKYIIERPAGMPDWVEIGIKVMVRDDESEQWKGPKIISGYDHCHEPLFRTRDGWWRYAKPYERWTPKEGEWCAFWDDGNYSFRVNRFLNTDLEGYWTRDYPWDYVARITNDDGSLIDIRCTVDELKAKTDWLGPEEK